MNIKFSHRKYFVLPARKFSTSRITNSSKLIIYLQIHILVFGEKKNPTKCTQYSVNMVEEKKFQSLNIEIIIWQLFKLFDRDNQGWENIKFYFISILLLVAMSDLLNIFFYIETVKQKKTMEKERIINLCCMTINQCLLFILMFTKLQICMIELHSSETYGKQ